MNTPIKYVVVMFFILLSIFSILTIIIYEKYPSQVLLILPLKQRFCSFNDIDACQSSYWTKRTFLYIIWGRVGFCSELNQLLLAFAYSVSTKRRFIIDSRHWNYGKFSHYFNLPSTNYYEINNRTFIQKDTKYNTRIMHLKTTRIGSQVSKFWYATRSVQTIPVKRHVAHYLWKSLSKQTFTFIQNNRIPNLSNYIGIHVRKGDKLASEARSVSLRKYISTIEGLINTNKTSMQIFVASDDHSVIGQLRQLKSMWTFFSLTYDHQQNTSSGHFQNRFNRLTYEQRINETKLFMCELQMLIDAKYVLCGMSSNVCRLVQILRKQHSSTTISLDRRWYGT